MGFAKRVRNYFFRGLAALLPTIVTIWLFVWGYKFINENISVYINRGMVYLIMFIQNQLPYTTPWPKETLTRFWVDGAGSLAGFILSLVAVCLLGAILASVAGKALWRVMENFIMNTPFLKRVYPYIKQVTDFFLTPNGQRHLSFSKVVATEYPRKGAWAIGMVTGKALERVVSNRGQELLTIFIPTSPTPFTGYIIMVPKEETIELDMTIEEAFRFTVSGGVITPEVDQAAHSLPVMNTNDKDKV